MSQERVFPSPMPTGCTLPYDGLVHTKDPDTGVYSAYADKNQLPQERPYEYWRTSNSPEQKNLWACKNARGGVVYNQEDHSACTSLSNANSVTDTKMNQYYDYEKNVAYNNKSSFASLQGQKMDVHGPLVKNNTHAGYSSGMYTATGVYKESSSANGGKSNTNAAVNANMAKSEPVSNADSNADSDLTLNYVMNNQSMYDYKANNQASLVQEHMTEMKSAVSAPHDAVGIYAGVGALGNMADYYQRRAEWINSTTQKTPGNKCDILKTPATQLRKYGINTDTHQPNYRLEGQDDDKIQMGFDPYELSYQTF